MHTVKPEPDTAELFFANNKLTSKLPLEYKRVVTFVLLMENPICVDDQQLVINMFSIYSGITILCITTFIFM